MDATADVHNKMFLLQEYGMFQGVFFFFFNVELVAKSM